MARKVLNSRLFSARNFILAENTQFRSSPLLVAAKRYVSVATEKNSVEITLAEKPKIRKILAEVAPKKQKVEMET